MAEEVKNEKQDNSAEAGTTTPDAKPIDPEDQTFWEDSVDAKSVDISDGQTVPKEATEDNPPAGNKAEQVETQAEEETASADPPPDEEAPAPEEESQQTDGDQKESPTPQAEEIDGETRAEAPGEDQPGETEPAAENEAAKEETPPEEETAAADTPPPEEVPAPGEEPQPKGKVLSFYRRLNKKTLIAGSGILLLIAGSIGFTVIPGLRSSDTITATFPGGIPETAYNMKFFLPLDVGYEKSQFVKVTIALELMDEGLQKEIDKNISQLRKEVIDLILTKSPKEVKSSVGKKELSQEITTKINNYLLKDCIKDTYFTELVIL